MHQFLYVSFCLAIFKGFRFGDDPTVSNYWIHHCRSAAGDVQLCEETVDLWPNISDVSGGNLFTESNNDHIL